MNEKLLAIAAAAVVSFAAGTAADASWSSEALSTSGEAPAARYDVARFRAVRSNRIAPGKTSRFEWETGLRGVHRYIVRFNDKPLASYRGGIPGFAATNADTLRAASRTAGGVTAISGGARLNANSAASIAYLDYLDGRHASFEAKLNQVIGQPPVIYRYRYSFNGMTLRMTQEKAARVSRMAGVASVQRDYLRELNTPDSVPLIGAPQIWNGAATGGVEARGEGVLIGIIDTGINTDHPSFAAVSPGDGYVHINPLGEGNFLGDCAPFDPVTNPNGGQPNLCNSKLIGTKVLPLAADSLGQDNAEDWNGHGSHSAGVAAGNLEFDVPLLDLTGNPTGIVFDQMSGVAPHANVAVYMACGNQGCAGSDLIAAIDSAIADGVDVINFSIGSGPQDPWTDADSLALLGARDAGVFVATSDSNDGPSPGTVGSPAVSPWLTSAGASTHGRVFAEKLITDMAGGDTTPPADIPGRSASLGYGPAGMVYAGDFGDPLCPQDAFAPGTFNGQIVLCDRGAYALVDKVGSVATGGGGAVIIANTDGSSQTLFDIPFGIAVIQIEQADGDQLRAWLGSGTGHTGRITASMPTFDPDAADIVALSSGRGPNSLVPDIVSPSVAAPGIDIYAAFYTPIEYASISGTSPASAHVAGAAALLRQLHPDWSAAEIHSVLASTGQRAMTRQEDGLPATPFEFGGGRVQLAVATNAGLVMHETTASFEAANPATGGEPKTLNLPSFGDSACLGTCTWQRTLRATTSGSWTAGGESADGLVIDVVPQSFTLAADETIQIDVSASVQSLLLNEWSFGWVNLTPDDAAVSPQSFPVAVSATAGFFPENVDLTVRRDAGTTLVGGFRTGELADLSLTPYGLSLPVVTTVSIEGEAGEFSPFGETGVAIDFYDVAAGSILFSAATANSTAPDVDLFVGRDNNSDGEISPDELLCESGNPADIESCELSGDLVSQGGSFWVAVVNFSGSGAGSDETELSVVSVGPGDGSFYVEPPASIVSGEPWQIRVGWDTDGMAVGETRVGAIEVAAGGNQIVVIPVDLTRIEDDVRAQASATDIQIGDIVDMQIDVVANLTPEDLTYAVGAFIPPGFALVPGSIAAIDGDVYEFGDFLIWIVPNPTLSGTPRNYTPSINGPGVSPSDPLYNPACDTGFGGYLDLEAFGIGADPGISGDSVSFRVLQGQELPFYDLAKTGITITDDGFGVFDSGLGATPWQNSGIPDEAEPNDMIAMAWGDLEIVYDQASNSGVTVSTPGPNLSVIEYDDMQPWPAGSTGDRIDFEVLISGTIDDRIDEFEIIAAYDNIVGDWSGVTIGVENIAGTTGTQYDGPLSDGLMICYDYVGPDLSPATLTYRIQAIAGAGGEIVHEISNIVDNPGSREQFTRIVFTVGADSDGDGVADSADNCTLTANADQRDTDSDGIGNACDADIDNSCFVNFADKVFYRANFFLAGDLDTDNDGDGYTDFVDLQVLTDQFFGPPGPSAAGLCTQP